jgi:hypothetical protein
VRAWFRPPDWITWGPVERTPDNFSMGPFSLCDCHGNPMTRRNVYPAIFHERGNARLSSGFVHSFHSAINAPGVG